jgi:hypothetical protein
MRGNLDHGVLQASCKDTIMTGGSVRCQVAESGGGVDAAGAELGVTLGRA